MRRLSWDEFDQAVLVLGRRFQNHRFSGVHGIPRGGLCLAVALSHALELDAFRSGCDLSGGG